MLTLFAAAVLCASDTGLLIIPGKQERIVMRDGRETVAAPKAENPVPTSEGVDRRIALSRAHIDHRDPVPDDDAPVILALPLPAKPAKPIPSAATDFRFGALEPTGKRPFGFSDLKHGKVSAFQTVTKVTSRWVRLESPEWRIIHHLPLTQVDPRIVWQLVQDNVDLKDPENRLKLVRFLRQSNRFGDAEAVLGGIVEPEVKAKAAAEKKYLQRDYASALLRELRIALLRGDYAAAAATVAQGKKEWLPEDRSAEWDRLAKPAADNPVKASQLRGRLEEFVDGVGKEPAVKRSQTYALAEALLREGVHPDQAAVAAEALETLPQVAGARDAFAQLVAALALGKEPRVETFDRLEMLLTARKLIRSYLTVKSAEQRFGVVRDLKKIKEFNINDASALLRTLGPWNPPAELAEEMAPEGKAIREKSFSTPGRVDFLVKLPANYHAFRKWPVLIALHAQPGSTQDMMALWGPLAQRWGFILVSASYAAGSGGFRNDPFQNMLVVDCVRSLAERYRIDHDRVHLTGHGTGAFVAWSAVLSRPEVFASSAPVGGFVAFNLFAYYTNAASTAIYCLDGDANGGSSVYNGRTFSVLNGNGYDAEYRELMDRGAEPFPEELEDILEFCAKRTRVRDPELIHAVAFRKNDAKQYWFQAERGSADTWGVPSPVKLLPDSAYTVAKVRREGNDVTIGADRIAELKIHVNGEMFDLSKPIRVTVNENVLFNGVVRPEIMTLLYNVYLSGDPTRLYSGVIPIKAP